MTQELIQHNRVPMGHVHRITNWRFATSANRLDPDNNFTAKDIDKVCYDAETDVYYILKALDPGTGVPTWYPIPNTFESAGEVNTATSLGDGVSLVAPKAGTVLPFKSLKGGTNITLEVDGTSITIVGTDLSEDFAPISHVGSNGESAHAVATGSAAGFMSAADKTKLDNTTSNATHTGDVIGATALTISANAVTFAKMQNSAIEGVLVGRGQGLGAGNFEQITIGSGLSMVGTELSVDAVSESFDVILSSEDLLGGDYVNIYNDSGVPKIRKACADNENTFACGYVLEDVASGDNAEVFTDGGNTSVVGQLAGNVYLSLTPGLGTTTPPTGAGNIMQILGVAVTTTKVNFQYQPAVTLI